MTLFAQKTNMIFIGHVMDNINKLQDNSIDLMITSPPYWGLRDYGENANVIWDGDKDCEHEWGELLKPANYNYEDKMKQEGWDGGLQKQVASNRSNFCNKCNAWKGQLGLEPTFKLYIQHLVQIFEALKPKLKKGGSLWINLGDSYYGGGNAQGHTTDTKQMNQSTSTIETGKVQTPVARGNMNNISAKSLVGIPDRFKIAMIDKGWICRNEIIWHKKSVMPTSAKDRFTVDFEKFFFFTKNKKYYFEQQLENASIEGIKRMKRGIGNNHKHIFKNSKTGLQPHTLLNERSNDKNRNVSTKRNMRTTWTINPKGFKEAHFAVMPEKLIETPIKASSPENGIVLDPFFGSGTTGVVAENLNRRWIGFEINEEYGKIANDRILKNRKRLRTKKNNKEQSQRI